MALLGLIVRKEKGSGAVGIPRRSAPRNDKKADGWRQELSARP
jgi:hypothetical protein